MKKEHAKLAQQGERLSKTVIRLIEQLKQAREDLSLVYDEPYVTTATIYG